MGDAVKLQTLKIDGYGNEFRIYGKELGTNTSDNVSYVRTILELYIVSGGYLEAYGIKVKCTGAPEATVGHNYYGPGTHKIIEADETFSHNADGSGSASVSAYFHSGIGNWDLSGSLTLTKLNRGATINTFTGTDIKENFRATYTTNGSGLTYKLKIKIPNYATLQTYDNYTSGTNVKLSDDSIAYIKNYTSAKTIQLSGVIETWSGNTKIGDSSEMKITVNIKKPAKIRVNGAWKEATPYVRVNGVWKEAVPYMRVNGAWKEEN